MASSLSFDDILQSAAFHFEQARPLLPMYLHLLLSALFPIYTGAHASLSRPSSAAKPEKRTLDKADPDDDNEEETVQQMEGLTPKDAILFPITAGVVLTTLYFAIKWYGANLINLILGGYFSLIGTYSVSKLVNDSWSTVESFITPTYYRDQGKVWKVSNTERKVVAIGATGDEIAARRSPFGGPLGRLPLPGSLLGIAWALRDLTKQKFTVKGYADGAFEFRTVLTRHNAISTVLGFGAVVYSIFVDNPWWLTNLQGFAVSYGALQLMSPTTFGTATLVLSGLFFYDIWAVFFTPLMVTVAKNLDVPIKLVFPRPELPGANEGDSPIRSYSMLGLGDIVLPGLMIALALRFDLYMFYLRKQKKSAKLTDGSARANTTDEIVKAPYVTATGHWGDKLWTAGAASSSTSQIPAFLTTTFPKPYFHATIIGYVAGMIATLVFMSIFQHAQPALLYLVPAVVVSLWGTGLARGELGQLWAFTEAINLEPSQEDQQSKGQQKAEDQHAAPKSIFTQLWCEVFGSGDATKTKETKPTSSAKGGQSTEVTKDDKTKGTDKQDSGTIFSIIVVRHSPAAVRDSQPSLVQPAEKSRPPNQNKGQDKMNSTSSDSGSDDSILVSADDLDDAK